MTAAAALDRLRQKYHEALTDARMHRAGYLSWRDHLASLDIRPMGLDVLEIGTGDRAPLALQLAADGAHVTAIDIRPVHLGWRRPLMWWSLLRSDGAREAIRTVVVDLFHTIRYWRVLGRLAGRRLPMYRISVGVADAARLPHEDGSFDLVVSSAVWEHLRDVRAATREVNRVLRPGGVAMIQIALFPSLRGGHQAAWHSVAPGRRTLGPWEHLRDGAAPAPTYLNGWRESQYREVIGEEVEVVDWESGPLEGQEYLTAAIRHELAAFSERDLLLPWVTAWCRRRSAVEPTPDEAGAGFNG